ncbi:MAG: hypothetical protein CVV56_00860 [Tenericutes bacterium HGW-Tenericutes-1]|jgi:hypothetical protein|nr:MAG: hypothetical protein CVV56_00860 [Tenericutes bacterium HGW-Tenericutes-1]
MPNELLWIIFALMNFILFIVCYKLFGKTGVFVWIAMGTILANIQVMKTVTLFGIEATLGNIMYGTIFLATDALSEKYGKKSAQKAVYLGFFTLAVSIIIMQIALQFNPNQYDTAQPHLDAIFGFYLRVAGASLIAYLISQTLDVYIFNKIKDRLPDTKWLWVRNNVATIISQIFDTAIFVSIAFIGVMDSDILWQIFISTFVIKMMVALLDTPFVYLVKKITPLND